MTLIMVLATPQKLAKICSIIEIACKVYISMLTSNYVCTRINFRPKINNNNDKQ